jgi:hypothetical protein
VIIYILIVGLATGDAVAAVKMRGEIIHPAKFIIGAALDANDAGRQFYNG